MKLCDEEEAGCSCEMGLRGKSCGHPNSSAIGKPEEAQSVMTVVCEMVDTLYKLKS